MTEDMRNPEAGEAVTIPETPDYTEEARHDLAYEMRWGINSEMGGRRYAAKPGVQFDDEGRAAIIHVRDTHTEGRELRVRITVEEVE